MLALEAEKVGTIIHANDELQRTLGHLRKNLIGKKINTIQPTPISLVHDRILRRFLDTAKRTVLNHNLQLFALTSEGYLRPIYIIVKLYPQISDRIIIVGYIQCLEKIDGFEMPKMVAMGQGNGRMMQVQMDSEKVLEKAPHNYVITDSKGIIACVTEGLWKETGLHSKFFNSADSFK